MLKTGRQRDNRPVILAVDDDDAALRKIAQELHRRYASDYRIACENSSSGALEALRAMRDNQEDVALLLAAQWTDGMTGEELLAQARGLHPHAKRGLLIDWGGWGDPRTSEAILRGMALGKMDYYVLKPTRSPDELFHRMVSEFLHEWSRIDPAGEREIVLVAGRWSPRGHELRELLGRNGVPHAYHPSDSPKGRRILEEAGVSGSDKPVVIMFDGRVLVDPDEATLASAYGVTTELGDAREFDVVVIGAGPAGLSAAVYASSEGLRALVIERASIGGQAGSSSLIRNYLGFPRGVTGAELAQRAYQQAWVFGTRFLLMREVEQLRTEGGRHVLTIAGNGEVTTRAVILATGVSYRRLEIPSLQRLVGSGVFYGASASEASGLAGEDVYVVGGGNSAGQAAMHLSRYARCVTLIVRGPAIAQGMSRYLCDELEASERIRVRVNAEIVDGAGENRLAQLTIRDRVKGEEEIVPAAGLFVLIGARPHTEWLPETILRDDWGFLLTGSDVAAGAGGNRNERMFETSVPGVFSVGDVRHGSVKRVASAVGEGSIVIQQVHQYFAQMKAPAAGPAPHYAGSSHQKTG